MQWNNLSLNKNIGSKDSSMPFSLMELVPMVLMLRDTCLGIIELAHPETQRSLTEDYREALRRTAMRDHRDWSYNNKETPHKHTKTWAYLFKVWLPLCKENQSLSKQCFHHFQLISSNQITISSNYMYLYNFQVIFK